MSTIHSLSLFYLYLNRLRTLFQKVKANLLDITAQDLLGKSHEELVLILIHLRRQSAALTEAIDSSKNELSQLRKMPPSAPQHPSILGGSSDGSGNGEQSSLEQHKVN